MAIEQWTTPGAYADAFSTATLNSIASGNSILSDLSLTNTNGDIFCDVSFNLASAAFISPNFIGIYIYPLNKDTSTYGDGRFGTSAAGVPGPNYTGQSVGIVVATAVQEGTASRLILPAKGCVYKFVLYNGGGVAFASSGNTCQYRTYNRSVA
jgi:hypothetical protein